MKIFKKHPKLIVGAFVAVVGAVGLLTPDLASASPVTLKAGDRIGAPNSSAIDLCTVAAVGNDLQGRKLALTAGHCISEGAKVAKLNGTGLSVPATQRTEIGVGIASKNTATSYMARNKLDYGFILLNDSVELQSVGKSTIAAPDVSQPAVRVGNDAGYPTTTNPVAISGLQANDFLIQSPSVPGASGGPVAQGDKLIGIFSRVYIFYGLPPSVVTRADAAIADAIVSGKISGFQPV